MNEIFADIAVPSTVDKLFTYRVPAHLLPILKIGMQVVVPFGKRNSVGFVVRLKEKSELEKLKSISDIIDLTPAISEPLMKVGEWISEYYHAPIGDVLKTMHPPGIPHAGNKIISLVSKNIIQRLSPLEKTIVNELLKVKSLTLRQLKTRLKRKNIYPVLQRLSTNGIIEFKDIPVKNKIKFKEEKVIELNKDSLERLLTWYKELNARKSKRTKGQIALIHYLLEYSKSHDKISITDLLKYSGCSQSVIRTLLNKNIIISGVRQVYHPQVFDLYESALGATSIKLNDDQSKALNSIISKLNEGKFHSFLLYGITGSGKTQVYIEAIRETIARNRTAIVLVPEISLTPQIARRFRYNLGDTVIVFHSRMTRRERFDAWLMAKENKISVVIGPRSAIFAPLKNVGLIVVDEEHESSYKQYDQQPRYHARDVAVMRAMHEQACIILGSATPSMESYFNAQIGKYTLLELPSRIDKAKLPSVQIIDMTKENEEKLRQYRLKRRQEYKENPELARLKRKPFEFGSISDTLKEKISDRLNKKEGIILLQNRRGFSPFIQCPRCGFLEKCDNCSISLTYHSVKNELHCHYCGFVKQTPIFCPKCQSTNFKYLGVGTQKVESELKKLFPSARILRMDLDTTKGRGMHDIILKKFSEGEADILLGTQMVAKGFDFPRVTLVGVVSADTQMLLPDFRSGERTFQLLTQVSGRAGRSTLSGEVVIQTLQPHHTSLQHVPAQDYKGFYQDEISSRKELNYPPFSRLILIEFKGKRENEVVLHAREFTNLLRKQSRSYIVLGPAAAAISKMKGYYRWHILIKSVKSKDPSGNHVHANLREVISKYKSSIYGKVKGVKMSVDVDPVSLM